MMLTKCYYVVYHVADFAADGEFICHQDTYRDHNNALLVAKDLAKCFDVVDDVYVIDGLTGEVLNTILKDEPQKDITEKNDAPVFTEEFDDGTGGMWRRANDGKWEYDCTGFGCSDCAYCGANQLCMVRRSATTEDRDVQIESAKERMCAKVNNAKEEKIPISSGIFEDGTGGVWQLIEDNKWNYQCLGVACSDCAYCDGSRCFARDPMTEEERDNLIKSAKERMRVKADNTEEEEIPAFKDSFDDGTDGVWRLTKNNKWDYNCTNLTCSSNCAYYNESHCVVRDFMTEKERNIQIKAAKERMRAKANETEEKENSSSSDIFDDGIGGVWKLAKNNTQSYNCKGLDCLDCAYYDEGRCSASGHVTKEERDILIKFAKAGIKK